MVLTRLKRTVNSVDQYTTILTDDIMYSSDNVTILTTLLDDNISRIISLENVKYVLKVNNIEPDSNGNVTVASGGGASTGEQLPLSDTDNTSVTQAITDLQVQVGDIDLANYYTSTQVDSLLQDKADTTVTDDLQSQIDDIDLSSYLTITSAEDTYATITSLEDYYLKTETDTLLGNKADVGDSYTKSEDDSLLLLKADLTYTNTQLGLKADKTYVDTNLDLKADKTTTYTKTQIDSQLLLKADKTYVDSQLLNKADKGTTDSRLTALENANSLKYRTRRNNSLATLVLTTALQTLKFPTVVSGTGSSIIHDSTSGIFSVVTSGYYNIDLKGRCIQTGLLATTFLTLGFVLNGGPPNLENYSVTSLTVPQTHSFVVEGVKLNSGDTFVCQGAYITSGGVGSGVSLVTNGVNNSQAIMIIEL